MLGYRFFIVDVDMELFENIYNFCRDFLQLMKMPHAHPPTPHPTTTTPPSQVNYLLEHHLILDEYFSNHLFARASVTRWIFLKFTLNKKNCEGNMCIFSKHISLDFQLATVLWKVYMKTGRRSGKCDFGTSRSGQQRKSSDWRMWRSIVEGTQAAGIHLPPYIFQLVDIARIHYHWWTSFRPKRESTNLPFKKKKNLRNLDLHAFCCILFFM